MSGKQVWIVSPGGAGERGGMGRVVSSFTTYWRETGSGPAYRVVDPYGPAANVLHAPAYLARALAGLLCHGLLGRVSLVHVHVSTRGSVVRKGLVVLLASLLRIPVVLHLHGADFDTFYRELPGLAQRAVAAMFRRADRVVVLGRYWRDFLLEELHLDRTRVEILLNAVRGPDVLPQRKPKNQPCEILFLGRIEPEKGIPELLSALASERMLALDWRLRLAGVGDPAPFEKEAARLELADRVAFAGWVEPETIYRWLAESEVFVLPSHREGLSMAVLEAMAYGLAVVTTPVGAHPEAIEDGVSGLLVPVGDIGALATALERAVGDTELRGRLQQGARSRFQQDFQIAAYCRKLEAIYEDVLGGQRRR